MLIGEIYINKKNRPQQLGWKLTNGMKEDGMRKIHFNFQVWFHSILFKNLDR